MMTSVPSLDSSRLGHSIASYFWRNVAEHSDAPAWISCDATVQARNWRELGELTWQCMDWLQAQGVTPGQHVASCLRNSLQWIVWDLAAQSLGLVHVAIDPREPYQRQQQLLHFSQAVCVLDATLSPEWTHLCPLADVPRSANQPPPIPPLMLNTAAAAQILFTSGSTGESKAVMLSHENLLHSAQAKLLAAPQHTNDLRLNILPFSHAYARTCELSTWILSAGQLAIARDWSDLLGQAPRLQPTLINLVPYLAQRAAQALDTNRAAFGERLRLLQVGGAGLPKQLWQRLYARGLPPLQGYGLTEASPVICSNRAGSQVRDTVGPPVAGVDVRLDEEGELWCRGPNVMLGYWQDPIATKQAIVDGWLRTGDLAEFMPDGHLRILGRRSGQIVLSTGYKVSPEPLEKVLQVDEWIERAILVGTGRAHVAALIWLTPQAPPNQPRLKPGLKLRIEARLRSYPSYATPKRFTIVEEPLRIENGTLTIKGTPQRVAIEAHFRTAIAALYQ